MAVMLGFTPLNVPAACFGNVHSVNHNVIDLVGCVSIGDKWHCANEMPRCCLHYCSILNSLESQIISFIVLKSDVI